MQECITLEPIKWLLLLQSILKLSRDDFQNLFSAAVYFEVTHSPTNSTKLPYT